MEATERLSLPMLRPGQAQKELFHNEALLVLDSLVAGSVEEAALNDPPQSPAPGMCYLIGDAPTGEWSPYANHLAAFGPGGWRYVTPVIGMSIVLKPSGLTATYRPNGWELGTARASRLLVDDVQVVGPQVAAIADPAAGTTVDVEARATLGLVLAALREHGLVATS